MRGRPVKGSGGCQICLPVLHLPKWSHNLSSILTDLLRGRSPRAVGENANDALSPRMLRHGTASGVLPPGTPRAGLDSDSHGDGCPAPRETEKSRTSSARVWSGKCDFTAPREYPSCRPAVWTPHAIFCTTKKQSAAARRLHSHRSKRPLPCPPRAHTNLYLHEYATYSRTKFGNGTQTLSETSGVFH